METTRLDELPVHNNSTAASMGMGMGMGMGNNNNNVVIQQYDPNMIPGNGGNGNGTTDPRQLAMSGAPPPGIDQRTLNELVSGVQRASGAGMTGLPSRDIPRESLSMQHDEQIKPNYIPREPAQDDYISRYESSDEVRENNRRSRNKTDTLEMLYAEFQMPILMGVVYFMFQMPALRTAILQFLPSVFNKDGNMNLQGLIMMSVGYSVVYYILTKVISTAESGIM
jgi:hypothetical protein